MSHSPKNILTWDFHPFPLSVPSQGNLSHVYINISNCGLLRLTAGPPSGSGKWCDTTSKQKNRPTTRFISRSINWKNWSINGCAIGDWEENLTCQDNTNLKRARKYMQEAIINVHETIFKYLKLNIKSQEMVKVNTQHNAFSNKSDEYEKSKSRKEIQ